jgi:hypothetical protein
MPLDCYLFYLWSIGEYQVSEEQNQELLKEVKELNPPEN